MRLMLSCHIVASSTADGAAGKNSAPNSTMLCSLLVEESFFPAETGIKARRKARMQLTVAPPLLLSLSLSVLAVCVVRA